MILKSILTPVAVIGASVLYAFFSGTYVLGMYEPAVTFGIPVMSFMCICLFGKVKAYSPLFCKEKKLGQSDFGQLKSLNDSLSLLFKVIVYTCLFFTIFGMLYFCLNYGVLDAMGHNLAAALVSIKELCTYGLIIFTLKGHVKHRLILMMAEESPGEKTGMPAVKKAAQAIAKLTLFIGFLICCGWGISLAGFIDRSKSNITDFADFPTILFLCAGSIVLLLISGVYRGVRPVFAPLSNGETGYTEKKLYQNAFKTTRITVLLFAFLSTAIACMAALNNLADKKYLGTVMYAAVLPVFYAVIINFTFLAFEAGIEKQGRIE
ncbi:hypothetical protein H0R92_06405 [Treponema sp. OMZ 840]|uniref:hypothetical protein n=1 Tax=Treponema sp. OMZ 840 TaxID=244313 RepID=UPI003D937A4C